MVEAGSYILQVTAVLVDGPQAGMETNYRFSVEILAVPEDQSNSPPVFVSDLTPYVEAQAGTEAFQVDV